MNQPRNQGRKVILMATASLTGTVLAPSCEARLHDATNLALRNYIFSLLDPANVTDLIGEGDGSAGG
jgi:hypothetical protein